MLNLANKAKHNSLREGEKRVAQKLCKDVTQQASVTFTLTGRPAGLTADRLTAAAGANVLGVKNLDSYVPTYSQRNASARLMPN